jgi:hypothetical protein
MQTMRSMHSVRYGHVMPSGSASRAEYVRARPTFAEAASLIGIDRSGVSRAVKRLGIDPDQADAIQAEIDAFFASLPEPKATPRDQFIAELRSGLPPEATEQAIEIYRSLAEPWPARPDRA